MELNDRIATIARDVQSRTDVAAATDEVVAAALDVLPRATGAGITLVHRRGRVETTAATSDIVRRGDELQYELSEGPCLAAIREATLVRSDDLGAERRWPRWAAQVRAELGVQSMLCAQLFTHENLLGALNVYSDRVVAFDDDDLDVVRLLAAHAAVAVAAAQEIESLKVAVDHRTTIGTALGLLMARHELDETQAMAVLRRVSSHENRRLFAVAEDVVRTRGGLAPARQT